MPSSSLRLLKKPTDIRGLKQQIYVVRHEIAKKVIAEVPRNKPAQGDYSSFAGAQDIFTNRKKPAAHIHNIVAAAANYAQYPLFN